MFFYLIKEFMMEYQIILFNKTILHFACDTGNILLVKYIMSLGVVDIKAKSVSIIYFHL